MTSSPSLEERRAAGANCREVPLVETHAISSDLTGEAAEQVVALWNAWRASYGLEAAACAINPHLTWIVGELDAQGMSTKLAAFAEASESVEIRFGAVQSFSCELPVVYLEVRDTPELRTMHGHLADLAVQAGVKIWKYYDRETWVPHVTLALRDIPGELMPRLVEEASARSWIDRTVLDRLALVHLAPLQGDRRDHTYRHVWPLGRSTAPGSEGATHVV